MRHRRRGRKLGRNPSHQRALLRSLACNLLLTERDAELDDNAPKVKGRIVTTLPKAKEVRPLVERCVTIARRTLNDQRRADDLATDADRHTDEWRSWRKSDQWNEWNQAGAPVLAARRRAMKLLGNKEAVQILFDEIAPRYEDRTGGYTRILRLAKPRLGDAGQQAILEFVGIGDRDRMRQERSAAPAFEDETTTEEEESEAGQSTADESSESASVEDSSEVQASADAGDESEEKGKKSE